MVFDQLPWFVTFKFHRSIPSQRGDLVKIDLVAILTLSTRMSSAEDWSKFSRLKKTPKNSKFYCHIWIQNKKMHLYMRTKKPSIGSVSNEEEIMCNFENILRNSPFVHKIVDSIKHSSTILSSMKIHLLHQNQ